MSGRRVNAPDGASPGRDKVSWNFLGSRAFPPIDLGGSSSRASTITELRGIAEFCRRDMAPQRRRIRTCIESTSSLSRRQCSSEPGGDFEGSELVLTGWLEHPGSLTPAALSSLRLREPSYSVDRNGEQGSSGDRRTAMWAAWFGVKLARR
jgi:hypothetical protein